MIKPMTAARVSDLSRSLAFFHRQLDFEVLQRDDARDVAVINVSGYAILLAGPSAGALTPYLQEAHEVLPPAGTIHAFASDLERLQADLQARSLPDLELVERWWGDRLLRVTAPDGFVVSYWTEIERTADQIEALYRSGLDELEGLLGMIEESELDLRSAPEHWSARQIIHHLVHSEMMSLPRIMHALAEPGRVVRGNRYSQDAWVAALSHASMPVEPALALLTATRRYVLGHLEAIPDSWSQTIRSERGAEQSVRDIVSMLAIHLLEHVEDMRGMLELPSTFRPTE